MTTTCARASLQASRKAFETAMEEALGGDPACGIKLSLSDVTGNQRLELLVSLSPLRSGGVVGICQDVTSKRAAASRQSADNSIEIMVRASS